MPSTYPRSVRFARLVHEALLPHIEPHGRAVRQQAAIVLALADELDRAALRETMSGLLQQFDEELRRLHALQGDSRAA